MKSLNRYEGKNNDMTIRYYHSDSSPIGYVDVDTLRRAYDATGRLVVEAHAFGMLDKSAGKVPPDGYYRRYLEYNTKGDTIIKKVESSYDTTNTSVVVNIDRWEKDRKQRLGRHYRLHVVRQNDSIKDTTYHYSQRFAYDSTGKLALAWFAREVMSPAEPKRFGIGMMSEIG